MNAPTNPLDPASRPDPSHGQINQYTSGADFKQNQMIANVTVRAGAKLHVFGYYSLSFAMTILAAPTALRRIRRISARIMGAPHLTFAAVSFLAVFSMPHGFRVSPFVLFFTGAPFNVTTGTDLNGDSVFNDRPAFASSLTSAANLVSTPIVTLM